MNATRLVFWAMCSAGCVNEYHPEYHPVSIVSVNQSEARDVTGMPTNQELRRRADRIASLARHGAGASPPHEAYTELFTHDAGDPFVIDEQRQPIATNPVPTPKTPETIIGRGVSIGGNVRFYGNVTFNGDVYIDARHP
jgi:hypothetical protein